MIYELGIWLKNYIFFFNVLHYITFRALLAVLISFSLTLIIFPIFMKRLKIINRIYGGYKREYTPEGHQKKKFIPSMGGFVILVVLELSIFTLMRWDVPQTWIIAFIALSFGAVGFIDDLIKMKNKKGISAKLKLNLQIIFGFVGAFLIYKFGYVNTYLYFPFFKSLAINLGYLYIPFVAFIIIGSSNAVNLTDGLDGLAIGPIMTTAASIGIISYVAGNYILAKYLEIPYVPFSGELLILCMSVIGAGLGFLWFNTFPADIFMGDVGSLSLGATLGAVAVMCKSEIVLAIAGGIFIVETLSVIIQVSYFKATKGKRIFKMAPIHHHFEILGIPEPKIVVRTWIISILLAIIALSTLKLR